jgi:DNA-binding TFAR19-related protein (PDSD5 family)
MRWFSDQFRLNVLLALLFSHAVWAQDRPISFHEQILPILERRCHGCHQPANAGGQLNLTSYSQLSKGGKQGSILVPGKPEDSLMVKMISGQPPRMPMSGGPLTAEEIRLIRLWISQGATNDTLAGKENPAVWWSLRPVSRPAAPPVSDPWIRTPTDRFILAKLKEKGLTPSPEADRRTLIRRVTYDLHGLPPTPEEVRNFLSDKSPLAYEKLIDGLLASPRYGERWGRHWLDTVHYGESHGYDKDKPRLNAWPYRDYVIRSFNDDKPYARFVEEQLAGDVLFPGEPQGIVATGFIVSGPWDFVGHAELREDTVDKRIARLLDRDDMVMTAMSTFTSLTVHCARCHDHKFDPIKQSDYYSLQAVFAGVDRADRPYDDDPRIHQLRQVLLAEKRPLRAALQPYLEMAEKARSDETERLDARIKILRAKLNDLPKPATGPPESLDLQNQRKAIQQDIDETLAQRKSTVLALLEPAARDRLQTLEGQVAAVDRKLAELPPAKLVYAGANFFEPQGKFVPAWTPRPVHLLQRGSVDAPGELMQPGAVTAVSGLESRWPIDSTGGEGQRRAALAKWLTTANNPLTWRSIVNRVWHYHFGAGIVDSPNDFGRMGALPTHPELLDWLAAEFRDSGGSIKQLHRLILKSSVYRQSSRENAQFAKLDAGNQWLWRMNRSRLDAESVRDSALSVSGQLDLTMGGPSDQEFFFKDDHSPIYDYSRAEAVRVSPHRRGVYRFLVRSVPDPFMESLDCPDASLLTPKRNTTLTALQALAMLNDPLMLKQVESFAQRLRDLRTDLTRQVQQAYWLAVARAPTQQELALLVSYTNKHGLENFCRLLFNSNEFMFVD